MILDGLVEGREAGGWEGCGLENRENKLYKETLIMVETISEEEKSPRY